MSPGRLTGGSLIEALQFPALKCFLQRVRLFFNHLELHETWEDSGKDWLFTLVRAGFSALTPSPLTPPPSGWSRVCASHA